MNRRNSLLKEAGFYCAALTFAGLATWGYKHSDEGVKKIEYEKYVIAPLAGKLEATDKAFQAYIQDGVINAGDPLYKAIINAHENAAKNLENAKKKIPVEKYGDLPVWATLAGVVGMGITAREGLRKRQERRSIPNL